MRVIVSTDKCIASGSCVLACPQVFTQRESDGVVDVLNTHPPADLLKKVRTAIKNCPAFVFSTEDEDDTSTITIVFEE